MAERGIDISAEFPKPWTDETVRAADVVVSMGCGDACPIFPGKRYEAWDDLDDPAGQDVAAVRPIRDDIERRVGQLIDEIGLTSTANQRVGAGNARAQSGAWTPPFGRLILDYLPEVCLNLDQMAAVAGGAPFIDRASFPLKMCIYRY
jgi:hypothetical protein